MPCTPDSCDQAVAAAPKPAPKQTAAPTFSPAGGQLASAQTVVIEGPPGATIRYTTDGSAPTANSQLYSGPITVSKLTTIKAIATLPGQTGSSVASAAYEVAPPPAPAVAAPVAPSRVTVMQKKLELKEKVYFDTGKATIKPVSYSLLDEVAAALQGHADVKKVEIDGYTDNVGKAVVNKKLSQQRAESVKKYLLTKGIEPARLDTKGFGQENPIASNKTASGREQNRRVEFNIAQ